MCGIAGFIDKQNKLNKHDREEIIREMLEKLKHRGGDSFGFEIYDNVVVGHTRLAIVDSSESANQPMLNSGSMLSYNGEIYNHTILREKFLKNKNIASYSDTATLYDLLNTTSLPRVLSLIQGMYAFSFLDIAKKTLSLALDKFAIKPLYYIDTPEYFAWSSEAKAFHVLPNFRLEFEDELLREYLLFRYIAGNRTLFKGVYKMQAGEYLIYSLERNTIKRKRFFLLEKNVTKTNGSLSKIFSDSVQVHLMSDAPVGVQLSGGVDSSLVAVFASKFANTRLHTFSVGMKDPRWNEFIYSDRVAKQLRTKHHKILFTKQDFLRLFSAITYQLDEPIVHPNTIPMYLLAKEARKYTKVLLTGEGADEVFLGYGRHLGLDDTETLLSNAFSRPDEILKIIKQKGAFDYTARKQILNRAKALNTYDRMSFYDIYTYLPHVLLRQDKAGMAVNIENRVPFLDESVVQWGFDANKKIGSLKGKSAIKRIALKYLPEDLVLRKKCGFGLPIAEWLRDEDVLLTKLLELKDHKFIKAYFVLPELNEMIEEHLSSEKDNSVLLFSILALVVWHDTFMKE